MTEQNNDGRLSFDEAVHFVQQQPTKAAFAAMPVFDDNQDAAEGARVFVIEADGAGGYRVRFVAGPFFSQAFAANDIIAPGDVPERLRELRYLPTQLDEQWLDGQVQILIQKLMQAAGRETPQMPDYASAPAIAVPSEAVFPISFVGRRDGE